MLGAWVVVVLVTLSCATVASPLDAAAAPERPFWIQALVEAGATPDAKAAKRTPLDRAMHLAAWNGNVVAIRKLLEAGASIDGQDEGKLTALHQAAGRGHADAIEVLAAVAEYTSAPLNPTRRPGHVHSHVHVDRYTRVISSRLIRKTRR